MVNVTMTFLYNVNHLDPLSDQLVIVNMAAGSVGMLSKNGSSGHLNRKDHARASFQYLHLLMEIPLKDMEVVRWSLWWEFLY